MREWMNEQLSKWQESRSLDKVRVTWTKSSHGGTVCKFFTLTAVKLVRILTKQSFKKIHYFENWHKVNCEAKHELFNQPGKRLVPLNRSMLSSLGISQMPHIMIHLSAVSLASYWSKGMHTCPLRASQAQSTRHLQAPYLWHMLRWEKLMPRVTGKKWAFIQCIYWASTVCQKKQPVLDWFWQTR